MRILFISAEPPWPLVQGDKIRCYHLLKNLSKKHEIYYFCFESDYKQDDWKEEIQPYCKDIRSLLLSRNQMYLNIIKRPHLPYSVSSRISKKARQIIEDIVSTHQIDLLFVYQLKMSWYGMKLKGVSKIIDFTDSLSRYFSRKAAYANNPIKKCFLNSESKRLLLYEKNMSNVFSMGLFCAKEDLVYVQGKSKGGNFKVLPNGVDIDNYIPEENLIRKDNESVKLLFLGNLSYPPNEDGLRFFYNNIYPSILQKISNVQLLIVGKSPPSWVEDISDGKNVVVTGAVPDIKPYFQEASIVITPIRYGAGTRVKVLEAMAMAKPVVSTSLGCEGLAVESGHNIEIADTPEEFSGRILELVRDKEKQKALGYAARETVLREYVWSTNIEIISNTLEQLQDTNMQGVEV